MVAPMKTDCNSYNDEISLKEGLKLLSYLIAERILKEQRDAIGRSSISNTDIGQVPGEGNDNDQGLPGAR